MNYLGFDIYSDISKQKSNVLLMLPQSKHSTIFIFL
jgi:hypothetical protein